MPGRTTHLELPAHPASVSQARRMVRRVVSESARPELCDDAELLTSEVVTNALVHAGGVIGVSARVLGAGVRVEVEDGSRHTPVAREYGSLAGTGRGVRLLDLLARWGVSERGTGKAVWFELGETRGEGDVMASTADPTTEPALATAPDGVDVTLLHVPLLLHSAWQMHAESFLREYLLTQLDSSDDSAAIEAHAAASDALALLQEQIPAPDLGSEPAQVMAGATGPKVTAAMLTMRIPRSSVANFQRLDEMLDAALALAESDSDGGFLTPTMQPELRAMRRWLCAAVLEQARGESARPWVLAAEDLEASERLPMVWDDTDFGPATAALIAADDANLILAASPAALELLGYPAGQLVGRRLIAIIPERYHQAHLAGYTMHLLSGRSPLIGVPVTVPAVRCDGSEIMLTLTVRRLSTSSGRPVFLAEMTNAA